METEEERCSKCKVILENNELDYGLCYLCYSSLKGGKDEN